MEVRRFLIYLIDSIFEETATETGLWIEPFSDLCGPDFKLTLLCRCTRTDLDDADILITSDNLSDIIKAIQKRIDADYYDSLYNNEGDRIGGDDCITVNEEEVKNSVG